jgi:hypothetical protein
MEQSKKRKRQETNVASSDSPVAEFEGAPQKKSKKEYVPKVRSGMPDFARHNL